MSTARAIDVFFCYNRHDQKEVLEICERLKATDIAVWMDLDVEPGRAWAESTEQALESAPCAAIFIGPSGIGSTQAIEIKACYHEHTSRSLSIIPVLLPDAPESPKLPTFLRVFQWVDLRGAQDGVDRLAASVMGLNMTQTTRTLRIDVLQRQPAREARPESVDAWGIASVKSRLHALSEIVAEAASQRAAVAARIFGDDLLSILVPVAVEMQWQRAYATALEKLLKIPEVKCRIRDYASEAVPEGCPVSEGVLSARRDGESRVIVLLDDHPALIVTTPTADEQEAVIESVELHGRLGVPNRGGLTLAERIGEVAVRGAAANVDELAAVLFENREALAPLVARHGVPGGEWLSTESEDYPSVVKGASSPPAPRALNVRPEIDGSGQETNNEIFHANQAATTWSRRPTEAQLRAFIRSNPHFKSWFESVGRTDQDPTS